VRLRSPDLQDRLKWLKTLFGSAPKGAFHTAIRIMV
jgi:hypothetical protein